MIGDSDDGIVVRFCPRAGFCRYRSVLAHGAILFGRGGPAARRRGSLDDKTRWLAGAEADARFDALPRRGAAPPPRRTFPEGGYYILGTDFESAARDPHRRRRRTARLPQHRRARPRGRAFVHALAWAGSSS